jgi:hypothetical protein
MGEATEWLKQLQRKGEEKEPQYLQQTDFAPLEVAEAAVGRAYHTLAGAAHQALVISLVMTCSTGITTMSLGACVASMRSIMWCWKSSS